LRHIQRTRVIIHLLDGLGEDPLADFSQINSELALFDPNLAKKPQIVALNKIDQPEVQERLTDLKKKFQTFRKVQRASLFRIRRKSKPSKSAPTRRGLFIRKMRLADNCRLQTTTLLPAVLKIPPRAIPTANLNFSARKCAKSNFR